MERGSGSGVAGVLVLDFTPYILYCTVSAELDVKLDKSGKKSFVFFFFLHLVIYT